AFDRKPVRAQEGGDDGAMRVALGRGGRDAAHGTAGLHGSDGHAVPSIANSAVKCSPTPTGREATTAASRSRGTNAARAGPSPLTPTATAPADFMRVRSCAKSYPMTDSTSALLRSIASRYWWARAASTIARPCSATASNRDFQCGEGVWT